MESKQLLSNQIEQLKKFLLSCGYTQKSVDFYSHCWNRLQIYANENGFTSFSAQIGGEFLKSVYEVADFNYPKGSEKKPVRAIRLLEAYVETGRMAGYADSATIFNTVSKYIRLAGIKIGDRNHGPHSLRHSMASGMLENHATLPVIAAALGHNNTKNTSRYLKIDIELLRSIALEVPQ